jgi:maleylpyruvate isomerase
MVTRVEWLDRSTQVFIETLGSLTDADLDQPSLMPGWTRRHVAAHVYLHAGAIRRMLMWGRTGVGTPTTKTRAERVEEVERGSTFDAADLRRLVRTSADGLSDDIRGMPRTSWDTLVVTPRGRTVKASETIWMRTREVVVRSVDLDAGVGFSSFEPDLVIRVAVDAAHKRAVAGDPAALAAWLTGRTAQAPPLAAWP